MGGGIFCYRSGLGHIAGSMCGDWLFAFQIVNQKIDIGMVEDGYRSFAQFGAHVRGGWTGLGGFRRMEATVGKRAGDDGVVADVIVCEDFEQWFRSLNVSKKRPIHDQTLGLNHGIGKEIGGHTRGVAHCVNSVMAGGEILQINGMGVNPFVAFVIPTDAGQESEREDSENGGDAVSPEEALKWRPAEEEEEGHTKRWAKHVEIPGPQSPVASPGEETNVQEGKGQCGKIHRLPSRREPSMEDRNKKNGSEDEEDNGLIVRRGVKGASQSRRGGQKAVLELFGHAGDGEKRVEEESVREKVKQNRNQANCQSVEGGGVKLVAKAAMRNDQKQKKSGEEQGVKA
jgi:hypothetical protein